MSASYIRVTPGYWAPGSYKEIHNKKNDYLGTFRRAIPESRGWIYSTGRYDYLTSNELRSIASYLDALNQNRHT